MRLTLIDSSVWVDFTRTRTPRRVKEQILPYITDPSAHLAEPVRFELLRNARPDEEKLMVRQLATLPVLATPEDLWEQALQLGQACRASGSAPTSMDLVIAAIALHHGAEVVTFDRDFLDIAAVSALRVERLVRADVPDRLA